MNIGELFTNKEKLNQKYNFFLNKHVLKEIGEDFDLVNSHLAKARHNMQFFDKNSEDDKFNDWLIVTLYYVLYHCVLALIVNKKYSSKNHTASLIFLIKHYSELKDDINLLHDLSIKKDDAELYTNLKEDRHKASYETKHSFSKVLIKDYKERVIYFIQKTEELVNN